MVFFLKKDKLLHELEKATTYLKSYFIFLKTKDTCMTKKNLYYGN
jgi:hypothetical protein